MARHGLHFIEVECMCFPPTTTKRVAIGVFLRVVLQICIDGVVAFRRRRLKICVYSVTTAAVNRREECGTLDILVD